MLKLARVCAAVAVLCSALSAANTTRYFKEDHKTGAMYVVLAPDGSYSITGREHMGVSVVESGRWSKSGTRITFTPNQTGMSPYSVTEIVYRDYTFLSLEGDSGLGITPSPHPPGVIVPLERIERELAETPETVPPYVFFEVSATMYEQETSRKYPFRFLDDKEGKRGFRIWIVVAIVGAVILVWVTRLLRKA